MKNFHLALLSSLILASSSALAFSQERETYSFPTSKGEIQVTPFNDNIFKITVVPKGTKETKTPVSQSAVMIPEKSNIHSFWGKRSYEVISPTTKVIINRSTGQISFTDSKGNLIISEKNGIDNSGNTKSVSFTNNGGNFFGTGERGHSLRLNGDTLVMYNRQNYGYTEGDPRISQMNITVPYFVNDQGYGILFDDYNKAKLILSDSITYLSDTPQPLSYYFINGNGSLAGTSASYTKLTGRQQLPPFWALGYITSKYGYRNQDETLAVIDTLKKSDYPVDGIVLDLYWYGEETDMGKLEWNKNQWPDHKKMIASLKEKGVNLVAISQPYINKKGAIDNYNFLKENNMLTLDSLGNNHDVTIWVGESGMFDISNPKTREWLWNRYKTLTDDGIEGWWGDLGEPEVHPETIRHFNGQTAEQYHNVYGNEWSRLVYEGLRKDFPNRRPLLLMRGGTAGLQRYSVFPWSTDVSRTWGGLQPQIKIMLNSGLSGLGYMSSDIGGFAVDPNIPDDPELYVRWLQMGTFSPTLRTHAQKTPEPYHFPSVENISKKFIRQRYEWLPYNYTLAYDNTVNGLPLVRPLNFQGDNSDPKYALIHDEYLWGDNILVAPVLNKGERMRKVHFPAGEWINWNDTKLRYKGNTSANVKAPLDQIPLFVKAGSFIPQYMDKIGNTSEYNPENLTILYFPSDKWSEYILFDDDRISPSSLEDGQYQLTTFSGKSSPSEIILSLKADEGKYHGMPAVRNITFKVIRPDFTPKSIQVNDKEIISWNYDSLSKELIFTIPWDYKKSTITIKK